LPKGCDSPGMKNLIEHASVTDQGLNPRKKLNEDNLLDMPQEGLFLVADGVGGAYAGHLASQAAVDAIIGVMKSSRRHEIIKRYGHLKYVEEMVLAASRAVFELSVRHQKQMGSTIALMFFTEDTAIVAHAGDSRVYLLRNGKLLPLTVDHSRLNDFIKNNPDVIVDPATFKGGRRLTKALGIAPEVYPALKEVDLEDGDIFLACTDGVYNYNAGNEIIENLSSNKNDLAQACNRMRDVCYAQGAMDHLTAIVVKVGIEYQVTREIQPVKP